MFKRFSVLIFSFCIALAIGKFLGAAFDSGGGDDISSKCRNAANKKTFFRHHIENSRFRSTIDDINDWQFDKSKKSNTEKLVAAVCAKKPQQDDSSSEDTSTDSSKD